MVQKRVEQQNFQRVHRQYIFQEIFAYRYFTCPVRNSSTKHPIKIKIIVVLTLPTLLYNPDFLDNSLPKCHNIQ